MHIVVVGVDHTTASIALRERLTYSARQIPAVLSKVRSVVQEGVLLSTCNRLELYAVCSEIGTGRTNLINVLSETSQVEYPELQAHSYDFADEKAVSHLFEVTC